MKIGLFTDTFYPQISGVAASVAVLKAQLTAHGHEVYIFTTTDPNAAKDEDNIYRLPSLPFVSKRRIGLCVLPRLKKLVRELEIDLIHTHTEFPLGQCGRWVAKTLNLPLVHTMHTIYEDYTHYVAPGKLGIVAKEVAKKVTKYFCNAADEVIVPSDKTLQLLLSYGVIKRISVIPTGIDLDKFSPSKHDYNDIQALKTGLGIPPEDKIMLYIGRVSEEKNIREVLQYSKEYLRDNTGVKFLVIGDGPARVELEEETKSMGISDKVIFAGQRKWTEIAGYYQLGDVFVTASKSETQGLTYIESLSAGVPVIAKSDPCIEGVVQNGINGYTFDGREDFLEALHLVLGDDALRKKLSDTAEQSVYRYSSQQYGNDVEKLYTEASQTKREEVTAVL